jgi:glucosamine-6-phosphate deaminase
VTWSLHRTAFRLAFGAIALGVWEDCSAALELDSQVALLCEIESPLGLAQGEGIVQLNVLQSAKALGEAAARHASESLRRALTASGRARIVAATGVSQFEFLEALTASPGIDWSQIEMFHLDEYIGLPANHPASFRQYLTERLIKKTGLRQYHFLNGEADPQEVIRRVGRELARAPIDLTFVGIGENRHLAFNDPPADFVTEDPYIVVRLDEACRKQQVEEGWFQSLPDVPSRAISMSVRQILKAKEIIAVVPGLRKSSAVKACLEGDISPMSPASILRTHPNTVLYLDLDSASLLRDTATRLL